MIQHKIHIPSELLSSIFGTYDSNIRKIEDEYKVSIVNRGDDVVISGEEGGVLKAKTVVNALINLAKSGQIIEEVFLNYFVIFFVFFILFFLFQYHTFLHHSQTSNSKMNCHHPH